MAIHKGPQGEDPSDLSSLQGAEAQEFSAELRQCLQVSKKLAAFDEVLVAGEDISSSTFLSPLKTVLAELDQIVLPVIASAMEKFGDSLFVDGSGELSVTKRYDGESSIRDILPFNAVPAMYVRLAIAPIEAKYTPSIPNLFRILGQPDQCLEIGASAAKEALSVNWSDTEIFIVGAARAVADKQFQEQDSLAGVPRFLHFESTLFVQDTQKMIWNGLRDAISNGDPAKDILSKIKGEAFLKVREIEVIAKAASDTSMEIIRD